MKTVKLAERIICFTSAVICVPLVFLSIREKKSGWAVYFFVIGLWQLVFGFVL